MWLLSEMVRLDAKLTGLTDIVRIGRVAYTVNIVRNPLTIIKYCLFT